MPFAKDGDIELGLQPSRRKMDGRIGGFEEFAHADIAFSRSQYVESACSGETASNLPGRCGCEAGSSTSDDFQEIAEIKPATRSSAEQTSDTSRGDSMERDSTRMLASGFQVRQMLAIWTEANRFRARCPGRIDSRLTDGVSLQASLHVAGSVSETDRRFTEFLT